MDAMVELTNPGTGELVRLLKTGAETGGAYVEGISTFPPTLDGSPFHEHPRQEERIEVVEGSLIVRIEGKLKYAGPGSTVVIPPGVAHEVANAGREPARVVWQFVPALRTDAFLRAAARNERRAGASRWNRLLGRIAIAAEFSDVYRTSTLPWVLQWPVFAVVARLARRTSQARNAHGGLRERIQGLFGERARCIG